MKKAFFLLFLLSCLEAAAATGYAVDGAISAMIVVALVLLVAGAGYLVAYLRKRHKVAHENGVEEDTDL
ncbi:MAG: hypothetical protein IPH88_18195 [Bacteroidales bacterium]|nr:hypothetical protein [Bacteroidales bacterium]